MSFLRPELLWVIPLFPAMLAVVLVLSRSAPVRSNSGAVPARAIWKRRLPWSAMLVALTAIGFAMAGPQAVLGFALARTTVVLALDVSGSMDAQDILPSRLLASQSSAQAFVDAAPGNMQIGVVVFSDAASLLVAPTLDRRILKTAIAGSKARGGTAIGDGLLLALGQIIPDATTRLGAELEQTERRTPSLIKSAWKPSAAQSEERSCAIILLTDGQNTDGVDPREAAKTAAAHGIRIFAIGFGTDKGVVPGTSSSTVRVPMNEYMLHSIADMTRAEYFHASNGAELQAIYGLVEDQVGRPRGDTEVTAVFALIAAAGVAAAGLVSLAQHGRFV